MGAAKTAVIAGIFLHIILTCKTKVNQVSEYCLNIEMSRRG
jgi:hypothetical protein